MFTFVNMKFALALFCWYNFTLASAIFTKYYLNESNGDSVTFTLVTFAFGAFLKVLFDFKRTRKIFSHTGIFYLAVCNVASLFLTNIAINQTTVSLIYVIKVN